MRNNRSFGGLPVFARKLDGALHFAKHIVCLSFCRYIYQLSIRSKKRFQHINPARNPLLQRFRVDAILMQHLFQIP